ncbi:MAG: sugar ABC transporter ATP-binding protein [Salinisphaera sp.]|jgi:simple sugar transport system ATP-binding protein|nr:sugar ABC transporter ATP-binding protein [Salinisphaera sp.]
MANNANNTVLSVNSIQKQFAGVHALNGVSLSLERGRVHCLAGENGSGKSTLFKVISGVEVPDAGTVSLDGHSYKSLTPRTAIKGGIQIIYQDLSLFSNLSVEENIVIAPLIAKGRQRYSPREARVIAEQTAARIGVDLPFSELASEVSIAQRQLTAICRALAQDAQVLIMDEPTTALTKREVDALFVTVRLLRDQGVAVVFVSHKFDEMLHIADEITVLRNGRVVAEGAVADFDHASLSEAMTGQRIDDPQRRQTASASSRIALSVDHIGVEGKLSDVSLTLNHGEILGITGLLGSGRETVAEALFGVHPITSGQISIDGKRRHIRNVPDAIELGIGYVPGDRLNEGLFLDHTIAQNIVSASTAAIPHTFGLVLRHSVEAIAKRMIEAFGIKTPSSSAPVRTLSGGNQQRVVLAKWFVQKPRILILNGPTVGVDIGSKQEIISLLRNLSSDGTSIIIISDDVPELAEVADRIIVMRNGEVAVELCESEICQDRIFDELAA